jgi:hypothetical protein
MWAVEQPLYSLSERPKAHAGISILLIGTLMMAVKLESTIWLSLWCGFLRFGRGMHGVRALCGLDSNGSRGRFLPGLLADNVIGVPFRPVCIALADPLFVFAMRRCRTP